jgi:ethanolamine utilization protein EutL
MITCSSDDALYAALDEGTKAAEVEVVYAKSFYAGAKHASGPFSGEIIGIFAAYDPEILKSGINATVSYLENKAWFYAADEKGELPFFPHVISETGLYLSKMANIPPGTPLAYLIAPPIEAMLGLDAALKAADVKLSKFYPPPSETNFCGGLLSGTIYSCEAAARAFQETVLELAMDPLRLSQSAQDRNIKKTLVRLKKLEQYQQGKSPYKLLDSGFKIEEKPVLYTHLFDDQTLVRKNNPIMKWRGKLDLLQAYILEAQLAAGEEGEGEIEKDIYQILEYARKLMQAEVLGKPCPEFFMSGFNADDLHKISHNTMRYLNVGFLTPDASMGKLIVKLNLLRAFIREVELCAIEVFDSEIPHMNQELKSGIVKGLNRLSNAVYVLTCKAVSLKI